MFKVVLSNSGDLIVSYIVDNKKIFIDLLKNEYTACSSEAFLARLFQARTHCIQVIISDNTNLFLVSFKQSFVAASKPKAKRNKTGFIFYAFYSPRLNCKIKQNFNVNYVKQYCNILFHIK